MKSRLLGLSVLGPRSVAIAQSHQPNLNLELRIPNPESRIPDPGSRTIIPTNFDSARAERSIHVLSCARHTSLAAFALVTAACGGGSPESKAEAPAAAPAAAPAEDHSAHAGGGKVFFTEPANGATVKSPVHLVFGSDMFTIAPVPPGEITEAKCAPNTGHFHLGVDTDCLPAGSVIPKANPWVHFGDGKNTIDMQLSPGHAQAGRSGG